MKFSEIIEQASDLLQRKGRLSYRALKLEFDLNDEQLEALKDELLFSYPQVRDEGGRGLVWTGATPVPSSEFRVPSSTQPLVPNSPPPISYTPPHLAERIRAATLTEGERKTITALFADLKGSTALIEGLDPEEARAIIDPALQLMMDAVHQYDGYVAQALGDGIFALFGAPLAHEDHPQRALYAALRMQEEMRRYSDQVRLKHGVPLAMRVGVNTGEVVVRSIRKDDLHTDYVPVGHSTNLAACMEQMATPGAILITDYTRKLVEGYFELKALGAAQIKGVEAPLNVYEVLGAGPLRTRLQVAARRGLTRFVGRQSELEQLRRALDQAQAGQGQLVGVMGEPGLGKSRLFYEFKLTSQSGCLVLEAFSVSHGKASPYLPVIELLKSYFQIQLADDERTRREHVIGKVLGLDRSLEDTLAYLFALLGIEEQPSPLQQMDPQIRRRRTFAALKKLFLRESLNQPLMLIFEDLHWIDSETQGFLDTLSESVASARILLLVNYRPEYRQEWGQKTYYTQLRLAPLGKEEAEELLTFLLGTVPSLKPLKQLILKKTEGTPFFMEEVVQTLSEEGVLVGERGSYQLTHHAPTLHIPTTVQGVLAARIDRLATEEKTLLQQLAVIGREFPLSLMQRVIPPPEEELYRLLAALQRKEFLYEQPAVPEVEYLFKHALTQDVAYHSVLIERRKELHERTAQAIEGLYNANLEDHYSELAHHYSRSGNTKKAVEYLQLAGQQAVQRSAHEEAIQLLIAALEMLMTLPDTPERTHHELDMQMILGPAFIVSKGWGAPEAGRASARARDLAQQMGETARLFPALFGLWLFHTLRAEHTTAYELGEHLLRLAQGVQDPRQLLVAHHALWSSLFYVGDLVRAHEQVERGLAFYDPQQYPFQTLLYSVDPGVNALCYAAYIEWFCGYPDRALQRGKEALALAYELLQPFSLAFALHDLALLYLFCRERQATHEMVERCIALANEKGFAFPLAFGTLLQGWLMAEQGQPRDGIAQMRQEFPVCKALSGEVWYPWVLALLAEAYSKGGQAEAGLSLLAEALELVNTNGERIWEAELYRLKGTLTLQKFQVSGFKFQVENPQSAFRIPQLEAEACFLRAIDIAQKQQAKSLELRATVSLARLWQQQGKVAEAHQMLSSIYNWFTEGFDTKDLQEAKALREELNS